MAVFTPVSDDEIAKALAHYDVGELVSAKGIAEGIENSNFLITCRTTDGTQTRYILTLYEKRVKSADIPFFLELKQTLAERGFPCPTPIIRRDGALISTIAGKHAALISFLSGKSIAHAAADHMRQLGQCVAQMHNKIAGTTLSRENDFGSAHWDAFYAPMRTATQKTHPEWHDTIQETLNTVQHQWPKTLPSGIIHADLFPDNVFFTDDMLSGVIDFYFACTDILAYELAIIINAWCFTDDIQLDRSLVNALLEGYETIRPLQPAERETLPLLCRGAALRFLLTRLHDAYSHDADALLTPKNPAEYAAKLRYFSDHTKAL